MRFRRETLRVVPGGDQQLTGGLSPDPGKSQSIGTPSLRARNTEKHLAWMTVLVPLVAAALTGPETERQYHARAITLCALTCLDVSSAELVHRNGAVTSRVLLDEAFQLLKPTALVV